MKPRTSLPAILLLAACLLLVSCGLSGSKRISFENTASTEVTVTVDDRLRLLIQPGAQASMSTPNNQGNRHILIVDANSTKRLDQTFSWSELEAMGFHIVIR